MLVKIAKYYKIKKIVIERILEKKFIFSFSECRACIRKKAFVVYTYTFNINVRECTPFS